MSELLSQIKSDQLQARKNRDSIRAGLLTLVISDATKITSEGRVEITDNKVLSTMRIIRNNIDLSLQGDPKQGIAPAPEGEARTKLETERTILDAYIPQILSETDLRQAIEYLGNRQGRAEPFTLRDTKMVKAELEARHPGRIDGQLLSTILRG